MAGRYSLTIQVDPSLPGHVALVINDPSGQTFAGFGPEHHHSSRDKGKFDVHSVQPGEALPADYSNVFGEGQYATFTIPISEAQARAAHNEINRIQGDVPEYNGRKILAFDPMVCTTIVNRITEAAGLGNGLLFTLPSRDIQYLSDVERALAANRKARFFVDEAGQLTPIPEAFRDIRRDYAYVGGGYDTPSERVQRVTPVDQSVGSSHLGSAGAASWPTSLLNPTPMDPGTSGPFGTGGQFMPGSASSSPPLYETRSFVAPQNSAAPSDAAKDIRVLRRVDGRSGSSVFDTGAPAVPFSPSNNIFSPGRPASFNDRFGDSTLSPAVSAPPRLQPAPDNSTQIDPRNIRVLRRVGGPDVTQAGSPSSPSTAPNQPQPQAGRPPGLIAGQPMPDYPVPPMVFGLPDPSTAPGNNMEDWLSRWIKPLMQQ